jgi:hypothetical protein
VQRWSLGNGGILWESVVREDAGQPAVGFAVAVAEHTVEKTADVVGVRIGPLEMVGIVAWKCRNP